MYYSNKMNCINSNNNCKELYFEYFIKICVFDILKYLLLDIELLRLSICNKNINNSTRSELLKLIVFPMSIVFDWNETNLDKSKNDIRHISDISSENSMFLHKFPKVTHINFRYDFNIWLSKGLIPETVTHLTFGRFFVKPISKHVLPIGLKYLSLGHYFDKPIVKDTLPDNLTHLVLSTNFNQPLSKDVLPKSLIYLEFGVAFTQPILKDVLPVSLEKLVIYERYDHQVDKSILETMTRTTIDIYIEYILVVYSKK